MEERDMIVESKRYFPILKAKRGELAALAELSGDVRDQITPLLEVVPVSRKDGDTQDTLRTKLTTAIRKLPIDIQKSWKNPRHFFLDTRHLPVDFRIADISPLFYLWKECAARDLFAVPVLRGSAEESEFVAVKSCVDAGSQGMALRISQQTLFGSAVENMIARAVSICSASRIDLILDLGSFSGDHIDPLSFAVSNKLRTLPRLEEWRSVVIAGTAFPEVSTVRPDSRATFSRSEWALWKSVRSANVVRDLEFGDYAIQHPKLPDGMHLPAPGIRYTAENEWVIFKGHKSVASRADEEPQYPRLSQQLIADSIYCKPEFSVADRDRSLDCANGNRAPGNPERWRRIGTRHLYHVRNASTRQFCSGFDQLANRWPERPPVEQFPRASYTIRNRLFLRKPGMAW